MSLTQKQYKQQNFNRMKKIVYGLFLGIVLIGSISCKTQQSAEQIAKEKQQLVEMIENHRFKFKADYAIPQGNFRPRSLTSSYGVTVTPDSINSFLPYFGVAYHAPFNSSSSPLDFESTQFDYTATAGKKGSTVINIQVKDRSYPVTFIFTLWENANADLIVMDSSRQSITFRGKMELTP